MDGDVDTENIEPIPIASGISIGNTATYLGLLLDRLRETHSEDAVWQTKQALEQWSENGYNVQRARHVQDTSRVDAGRATIGEVSAPEHVVNCLRDVIRYSRVTLREELGETITVYRGISENDVRENCDVRLGEGIYVQRDELESWTVFEAVAESFGSVILEREIHPEKAFFFGRLCGHNLSEYEEVTLGYDTYLVPPEKITGYSV